jgi:uncharacterized protein
MRIIRFFLISALFFTGCASSRMSNTKIDSLFHQGDYAGSAELLRKGLDEETEAGRDGLLYLLDLGIALHQAGNYAESTRVLLRADKLAEIKDYTSLSAEAGTLFTSDNIKQYKAEEFENVLISVYLALNFALEGKMDDALIECRRVNRKLYLLISEGKRKYELSGFASYFSGLLFESRGEWNDAYVSYKQTREILPSYAGIGDDLIRIAKHMKMEDEVRRWKKEYPQALNPTAKTKSSGQIVVVFQNGHSPKKVPVRNFPSVPEFRVQFNPVSHAFVTVRALKGDSAISSRETFTFQNIEQDAIRNLKEKWGGLLAKKIAGLAAKETLGNVINAKTGGSGVGDLLKLALYVSDQADVRSWSFLPKDLQLARVFVEPGTYSIKVTPIERDGAAVERVVQVGAGKTVFTNIRFQP